MVFGDVATLNHLCIGCKPRNLNKILELLSAWILKKLHTLQVCQAIKVIFM